MAAIPGRWGGLRSEPYKPNPPDADLDGIIQEQTLWERPKGFVFAMVDAAGRLAEVVDGADHPPGVDVFRQNFVLARRGDNGVLERVDNAPRPSWDRDDLSARDRFGTVGDRLGTIASPKSPYVPMAAEVVDPPIDRRAELRKRYPGISDAGLEMMLWEPTDDPDEIDRRLGFIEDLYGEDVSTNLRQFLDGVPPGDRVDADFSEMADDLPEEPFYVTVFDDNLGDYPTDDEGVPVFDRRIEDVVYAFRTPSEAAAVCPLPGAGINVASGMPAGLRVKQEEGEKSGSGCGPGVRLGRGAALAEAFALLPDDNTGDVRLPADVAAMDAQDAAEQAGDRGHALRHLIDKYKRAHANRQGEATDKLIGDMSDDKVALEILREWQQDERNLKKLKDIFGEDMTWDLFEEMAASQIDELFENEEFTNLLKSEEIQNYYNHARMSLRYRVSVLRHMVRETRRTSEEEGRWAGVKKFASMIAVMSARDDWENNMRRANALADLLSRDKPFEVSVDRLMAHTLANDGRGLPGLGTNSTLQQRVDAIHEFLLKAYKDNPEGLAEANAMLDELIGKLNEVSEDVRIELTRDGDGAPKLLIKRRNEVSRVFEEIDGAPHSKDRPLETLPKGFSFESLRKHLDVLTDEQRVRLVVQPSAWSNEGEEEAVDIPTLEALINLHLTSSSGAGSIRAGGGSGNIIGALEIFYGHKTIDELSGPKTDAFFWSLFSDEVKRRGAVDTHVLVGMIDPNRVLTFIFHKDSGKDRLNIAPEGSDVKIPFDPDNIDWQNAYKAKYGGDFEKIDGGWRWVPTAGPREKGAEFVEGEAYIDFVKKDDNWAMRGTAPALRAEGSGTGRAGFKNMIRGGSDVRIEGLEGEKLSSDRGWSYTLERVLEQTAEKHNVSPEVLQAAIWEYIRTRRSEVVMVEGGFDYPIRSDPHNAVRTNTYLTAPSDLVRRFPRLRTRSSHGPKGDLQSKDILWRRAELTTRGVIGEPLTDEDVRFQRLLSVLTEDDIRVLAKLRDRRRGSDINYPLGKDRQVDYEAMGLSPGLKQLLEDDPAVVGLLDETLIMFNPDEKYVDRNGVEHTGVEVVIAMLKEHPPNTFPVGEGGLGYVHVHTDVPEGEGWSAVTDEDDNILGYLRTADIAWLEKARVLTRSCGSPINESSAFRGIELKDRAGSSSCNIVFGGLPSGLRISPHSEVAVPENFADMSPEAADVVAHNILAGRDRSEWGAETRLSRVGLFQEHPQHRGFYLGEDGNFYDASDNMLADDGDIVPSPEFLEESDRALRALSEGIRKFDADAAKRASQRQDRLYGSSSDEPEASPELIGQLRVAEAIGDNFVASVREMDDRYRERVERPDGRGQFVYDLDEAARREKIREIEEAREQFSQSLQKFFDEERRYDPDNPPTVFMNTRSVAAREGAQRRSGGRPLTEAEALEEADRYRDIFKESQTALDEQAKRSEEWRNSERPMFMGPDRSYWSTSNIDSLSDSDRASRRSDIQEGLDNLWGEYGTGKGGDVTQRVGDSGGAYFQPPSDKAPEELLSTFASEKTSVLEEQLRTGRRRTAGGEVEMSDADRREAQTILDYLKNTSPEQQKKDIVDFLRRNVEDEDTVVAWRASPQTIGLVAEDGRIKTTHELEFSRPTGRTRADDVGATSPPTMRRAYETSIGIPVDTPDNERPVSGLVSYGPRRRRAAADILAQRQAELTPEEFALYDVRSDPLYMQAVSGAAEDYGTAMVEFKRDTNRNATFVIGDSLNIGGVPAGMENASDEELLRMVFDDTYRNAPNSADVTSHDRFMEMMILGRDEALGEGYAGSWRLPDSKVGRDSGYHEALLPGGSGIADVETVFLDGQYNTQVPGYRSGRPSLEVLQEQDRWMSLIPDEERDMLEEIVRLRGADSSEVQSALNAWKQLLNQFDESESRREIEETLKKLNQDLKIQWLENRGVSLERRIAAAKERLGTDDPIDLLMRRNLEKLLEGIRKQHANLLGR